jgi:hypothetical protein
MESLTEAQLLEAIRDKEAIAGMLSRALMQDVARSSQIYNMKPDETMNESRLASARKAMDEKIAVHRAKIQETDADIAALKNELRRRVSAKRSSEIEAAALARRRLVADARAQVPFVPAPPAPPKKSITGRKWMSLPRGGRRRRVTRRQRLYRQ